MAEITKKRQGELVRGVFQILLRYPDGLQAKNVLSRLEEVVPPTEFEASTYPNRPGVRRYEKIVRFSLCLMLRGLAPLVLGTTGAGPAPQVGLSTCTYESSSL